METDRASNNGSGPQRSRPSHGRTSGPTRRSTKGQWTTEEDEILRMAVQRYKGKNWKKIAECFRDRTDVQCLHRWQKVLNPDLVKGPWSKEEDEKIIELVDKYGPKKWSTIAQNLPGRIGKQCRERWHNHLNPNINKDAWTQEEEVILIRAHQMHGNKWAELTKYLPGRTDNSIKNHWNSSVRKKLDMYMSSGVLQQFQDVPLVSHSNHLAASSSSRGKQSSEDDIIEGGVEVEEASECSHGSAIPSMSQSINNTIALLGECRTTEDARLMPFSAEDYRPVFQEPTFSMPEVPCEQGDKFPENDFSIDWGIFEERDWQQNGNELPDVSLINVGQESSGLFWLPPSGQDNHESVPFQQEPPIAQGASTCMVDMVSGTDNCHIIENCHIIADSDCRIVYPEGDISGCCPSEIDISNMGHHTSTFQIPEGETSTSLPCFVPSEMLGNSLIQPVPFLTQLLTADDSFVFGSDINMYSCSHPTTEQEHILPTTHDDFINTKESGCSPCEDDSSEPKESRKLVPANDFVLDPSRGSQCHSSVDKDVKADGQEESGNLCYEPPRFPSLDMPFFSCDLIQPGSDMQLEYSPLGIRQLMLSSFKTWDSPSRDTSPDAVLKSAAKTFTGTPSILKKRNRDFMSPSSVKSGAKKLENSLRPPESFSHLASDRLEVMFDECVDKKGPQVSSSPQRQSEASCKENENVTPAPMRAKNQLKVTADVSEKTITEEEGNGSEHLTKISDRTVGDAKTIDGGNTSEMGIEISGILVEHDLNDLLLFSPDRCAVKTDRAIGHGNKCSQHLDDVSKQAVVLPSSEPYHSVLCSPQMTASKDGANLVITTSLQTSTTPANNQVGNSGKCVAPEFNAIFVETTPFKRAMESPSAWKSPWFFDCFAPGPKVDTDITVEDIGYFLSPGDHSYDAIGLMKQLGEQTAGAFADAQEVLGNETPESLLKAKCSMLTDAEKENHYGPNKETEEHDSVSASNVIMGEKRTLDFSDCGTPPSVKESKKFSSNVSFSSASSYLLKGCR